MRSIHIMYPFTTMACISIGFNSMVQRSRIHISPMSKWQCTSCVDYTEVYQKPSRKQKIWVLRIESAAHQNLTKVLRIEARRKCCALGLDESAAHSVPAAHRYFSRDEPCQNPHSPKWRVFVLTQILRTPPYFLLSPSRKTFNWKSFNKHMTFTVLKHYTHVSSATSWGSDTCITSIKQRIIY